MACAVYSTKERPALIISLRQRFLQRVFDEPQASLDDEGQDNQVSQLAPTRLVLGLLADLLAKILSRRLGSRQNLRQEPPGQPCFQSSVTTSIFSASKIVSRTGTHLLDMIDSSLHRQVAGKLDSHDSRKIFLSIVHAMQYKNSWP